jgi:hypothetical protein
MVSNAPPASEVWAGRVRSGPSGTTQIGFLRIRPGQIGIAEIRPVEIGASEVGPLEIGPWKSEDRRSNACFPRSEGIIRPYRGSDPVKTRGNTVWETER